MGLHRGPRREISIDAIPLVWYRLLVVVAVLAALVPLRGIAIRIPHVT